MWHFSIFVISSVICSINEMYLCLQILKTYQCSSMVKEVSKLVPKVAPLFHKKSSVFKVATATSSPTFWAVTCSTVRLEMVNDKTWLRPKTFYKKHCIREHSRLWSTYGFYARTSAPAGRVLAPYKRPLHHFSPMPLCL